MPELCLCWHLLVLPQFYEVEAPRLAAADQPSLSIPFIPIRPNIIACRQLDGKQHGHETNIPIAGLSTPDYNGPIVRVGTRPSVDLACFLARIVGEVTWWLLLTWESLAEAVCTRWKGSRIS